MPDEASDVIAVKYGAVGATMPTVFGETSPVDWTTTEAEDEVQTVSLTGEPTGGTFTLTFDAEESAAIPYDATAQEVEGALEDLATIGEGNIQVTGSAGGPWACTFINDLAGAPQDAMTGDGASLTGGESPDVSIVETNAGVAAVSAWTNMETIDGEKPVTLLPDAVVRDIRPIGSSRPKRRHVCHVAVKGVRVTLTESGKAAITRVFNSFADDAAGKVALSAHNVEATYSALAVEYPFGVFELKKVAPSQDAKLEFSADDIAQPEVLFETFEDDSGVVGYFHYFS